MGAIETIEYRGFDIKVYQDEMAGDPRKEWDNLGMMYCYHPRYGLGDEEFDGDEAVIYKMLLDAGDEDYAEKWVEDGEDYWQGFHRLRKVLPIMLPLYLLDHSGLWMKTGTFDCDPGGWDTSMVGFVFLTREQIKDEYGWKRLTEGRKEKLRGYLRNEVEIYSAFLEGSVYWYGVEAKEGNRIEFDDSCGEFYGGDFEGNGLLETARNDIDYAIKRYRDEVVKDYHIRKGVEWFEDNVSIAA